jgi:hypothetical protein
MSLPSEILPVGLLGTGAADTGYLIERSLRFNSSDSAYCDYVAVTPTDATKFTLSFWVKRNKLGTDQRIMYSGLDSSNKNDLISFISSDAIELGQRRLNVDYKSVTNAVFRDASAWYHIVYSWNAGARTLYVNGVSQSFASSSTTTDTHYWQTAGRTIYIGRDNNEGGTPFGYGDFMLADLHFVDGQALDPTSFGEFDATTGIWQPIAYSGSYGTNGFHLPFSDNSTAAALGTDTSGNGNDWTPNNLTDTEIYGRLYSQSTGSSTTAFSSANLVGNFPAASTVSNYIYDAELSTSVTSVTFGYTYGFSGVEVLVSNDGINWTSKGTQTSSYTTVTNSTAFKYVRWYIAGSFSHGITNNPANIDSLVDVPINGTETDTGVGDEVRGNYCTWNPLNKSSQVTLTNGNLDYSASGANTNNGTLGTIGVSSGKWYWEYTCTSSTSGTNFAYLGIVGVSAAPSTLYGFAASNYIYQAVDGNKKNNDVSSAYGASWTSGDVIGVAFDADNGTLTFYKNGSTQGTAYSSIPAGTYAPSVSAYASGTVSGVLNAGARPFAYTAPSGFKALNTANLPAPVVTKPSTVMDVKLYTGNGSTQTISGLNMSPDLVWIKNRSEGFSNILTDTVRGATNKLISDRTDAENTIDADQQYGTLEAFTSDGFTVNVGTYLPTAGGQLNKTSIPYVAWTWDAGSSTVSNTDGSITSSVRDNPSAGFSIVTYTGAASSTVGHGLGVAPEFIITKQRDRTGNWNCYHVSTDTSKVPQLDSTGTPLSLSGYWGSVTSTTFGTSPNAAYGNALGDIVAYCFAPVAGYSAFGSYTGNGLADGPFVYTGFRPRWILIKNISASANWNITDSARDPDNVADYVLFPNVSDAEGGPFTLMDINSNGFKLRNTAADKNTSGQTYIYAAFAEHPFQYARAR